MKRRYEELLRQHFADDRQMAFVSGPRQVGKTTTASAFTSDIIYLSWDNDDDRLAILDGPAAVNSRIGLTSAGTIIFDELHKYPHWKNFLKGFYDSYGNKKFNVVVTGSARLDVYRKGADSLMGRYFSYRMHPLSVGEIASSGIPPQEISPPSEIADEDFAGLLKFGGFPEPFLKRNNRFHTRWKRMRFQLLFREELRDFSKIHEIGQVEILAELIKRQTGQLVNFAALARKIRASQDSIRRWISVLESLYYCFTVRPWTENVSRSILKDPKLYLWNWSEIVDEGARNENFIASHLLKAVHWWNDIGFGDFGLYFLRTKDKREVDFLVTKDGKPWFLVEVKSSNRSSISRNLYYFHERLGTEQAFQVSIDADYVDANCFDSTGPVLVPARTFLSQLV